MPANPLTQMNATDEPLMTPWAVDIDLVTGAMAEPDRVLTRKTSDMRGYYRDEAALEQLIGQNDPIHYEVFEKHIPETYGHLLLCISKLYPGRVGDECFMTKGHYHTMVYVPPHWAHRSINTGDEPLISFCVYPADAGHNYGDIATEGFPRRVFIRQGKEVIE